MFDIRDETIFDRLRDNPNQDKISWEIIKIFNGMSYRDIKMILEFINFNLQFGKFQLNDDNKN